MNTKIQNPYLELGLISTLKIDRLTTPGAYLMAQDGNYTIFHKKNKIVSELQQIGTLK